MKVGWHATSRARGGGGGGVVGRRVSGSEIRENPGARGPLKGRGEGGDGARDGSQGIG